MEKRKIHLTCLDEDGEDEVIEVECYSTDQARFLSESNGSIIVNVEEAVMRSSI